MDIFNAGMQPFFGTRLDLGRLMAIAATPCCTICQAIASMERALCAAPRRANRRCFNRHP